MAYAIGIYKFESESVIDEFIKGCAATTPAERTAFIKFSYKYFLPGINLSAVCDAAKQLKVEIEQKRLAVKQAEEVKKIQDRSPVQEVEVIEKLSNDKTKLYLMIGGTAILLGAAIYIATK